VSHGYNENSPLLLSPLEISFWLPQAKCVKIHPKKETDAHAFVDSMENESV